MNTGRRLWEGLTTTVEAYCTVNYSDDQPTTASTRRMRAVLPAVTINSGYKSTSTLSLSVLPPSCRFPSVFVLCVFVSGVDPTQINLSDSTYRSVCRS